MTVVQSGREQITEGSMTADGSYPANGFEVSTKARLLLKGPTFGGGIVHLTVLANDGSYYRTGRSWSALVAETIDTEGVAGRFKLELAGSSAATIGFEVRNYG